jgi:hypothetical protein
MFAGGTKFQFLRPNQIQQLTFNRCVVGGPLIGGKYCALKEGASGQGDTIIMRSQCLNQFPDSHGSRNRSADSLPAKSTRKSPQLLAMNGMTFNEMPL